MRQTKASQHEAVLLIGTFRSSLVTARLLSKAGYRVVTTSPTMSAIGLSRHVDDDWRPTASPWDTPRFVEALQQYLAAHPEIIGVMPLMQPLIVALLPHRDRLPVPLLVSNSEAIEISDDKARLSDLANRLGVSTAPFVLGNGAQEIVGACKALGFPCVFKNKASVGTTVPIVIIRNRAEAMNVAEQLSDACDDFMVQKYTPGWRCNRYFIADRGRILRYMDMKILRTNRFDDTGLLVSAVSMAPLARLDDPSARLVEALNYTGVGNVQYLIDEASGKDWLLEVNPLLGPSFVLPGYCGLDSASAIVHIARNDALDRWSADFSYPVGKSFAWFLGDIGGLLLAIERRELTVRQALRWLLQALSAGLRADCHAHWAWDDPLPALWICAKRSLLFTLRAVPGAIRLAGRRLTSLFAGRRPGPVRR